MPMNKIVFLDRDGVINRKLDNAYVRSWSEFEFLPGVFEAMLLLNNANFGLFIVSNQAGVSKGLMSKDDLRDIDLHMKQELIEHGIHVLDAYYCRHRDEDDCDCRKPQPGLLYQALDGHDLSIKDSWMVGDSERDIVAGHAVGCRGVLIDPSNPDTEAEHVVANLLEAAQYITR